MNALIQGSAARHTKLWMRACWREGIVPLLQMHDALACSVASPRAGGAGRAAGPRGRHARSADAGRPEVWPAAGATPNIRGRSSRDRAAPSRRLRPQPYRSPNQSPKPTRAAASEPATEATKPRRARRSSLCGKAAAARCRQQMTASEGGSGARANSSPEQSYKHRAWPARELHLCATQQLTAHPSHRRRRWRSSSPGSPRTAGRSPSKSPCLPTARW